MENMMTVNAFLDYLRYERNYSEKTIVNYGDDLRFFEAYCQGLEDAPTWEEVDADVVRGWMEDMMDRGQKPTTVRRRLSALRSFYKYGLKRGLVDHDPAHGVVGPKKTKPLPQFVREKDMQWLLDDYAWDDTLYKDVRARTILLLFYETGLRVSELVSLNDEMIDEASMQLKVTGKRNKQRLVPFGKELLEALRKYKALRDQKVTRMEEGLMLTEKGRRMDVQQVRNEVKARLALVTTMKKKSPHVLRHSFATAMLNNGAGLESVKQLLGHESLTTTEIYTHTTFEQLKKVYEEAHPRS